MGTIKVKGIVIKENNMGDFDKMITLLTPNGRIECSAKGARRPKSQLMSATQFLCFGEYMLFKSSSHTYTLNSCETIELFYNIRIDLDKLEYAANITKIIQDVTYENQSTYKILQLYLNTLYVISNTTMELDFITSIFKLRLISLLGLAPNISQCVECGEKDIEKLTSFSILDNGVKCKNCSKQDTGAIGINITILKAIYYIIKAPAKKIYSFNMSEENKKILQLIAKIYTNEKLEKEYK